MANTYTQLHIQLTYAINYKRLYTQFLSRPGFFCSVRTLRAFITLQQNILFINPLPVVE